MNHIQRIALLAMLDVAATLKCQRPDCGEFRESGDVFCAKHRAAYNRDCSLGLRDSEAARREWGFK